MAQAHPAEAGSTRGISATGPATGLLLTVTEIAMLIYWVLAGMDTAGIMSIPPEWMYSDHRNPLIVSWNWSFLPLDVLFAVLGLTGRFATLSPARRETVSVISLSLMFCAGLMAIAFWTLQGTFDPFWWAVNLWLMVLPSSVIVRTFKS